MDMEEDHELPVILGKPFMTTGRVLIDVKQIELIFRVQDEKEIFKATKDPDT